MHTLFNPAEVVTLLATRRMSCVTMCLSYIVLSTASVASVAQSNDRPDGVVG